MINIYFFSKSAVWTIRVYHNDIVIHCNTIALCPKYHEVHHFIRFLQILRTSSGTYLVLMLGL